MLHETITPDDAKRVLKELETRDLITAACVALVLVRERGYDVTAAAGPRRFAIYKGHQDRLGYLEITPEYSAAWYPVPTLPIQFDLPLTPADPDV